MIDASLNEVEALAAKAARGAGLAWGLAEETGKAARWLAACGLDWAPSLIALLDSHPTLAMAPGGPGEQVASPLSAGCFLADSGCAVAPLGTIAHPLWLLPFAARVAAGSNRAIEVSWAQVTLRISPKGGDIAGIAADLFLPVTPQARWALAAPDSGSWRSSTALPRFARGRVRLEDWNALDLLGARTYVPASAQSRAKGAGAGLTDND